MSCSRRTKYKVDICIIALLFWALISKRIAASTTKGRSRILWLLNVDVVEDEYFLVSVTWIKIMKVYSRTSGLIDLIVDPDGVSNFKLLLCSD